MSRIWWATIFGLLLGALFLAMLQRGCDASADINNQRLNDPAFTGPDAPVDPFEPAPENLAPITLEAATPNLGRRTPVTTPEPVQVTPPVVDRSDTRVGKTREELRQDSAEIRANTERRLEEIRQRREENQRRSRELARQLGEQSGQLRLGDAARLRDRNLTPNTADAQRRFREQLTRRGLIRSGDGGGQAAGGDAIVGGGEAGGDAAGDGDSAAGDSPMDALQDLGVDIPSDALQALNDLGGVPNSDPGVGSPLGDERTETGFSNGGVLAEQLLPVARWEAVAQGRSADGRDLSSADLFLGFATRPTVPVISSRAEDGLMAPGGGFFSGLIEAQETIGSTETTLLRSTRLDSFVTLGGAVPFFTPGSVSDPAQWGESIVAEWATTDFNGFVVLEPDPERFGDERYYLWIGRFTAPAGVESVSGTLGVTWLDLASFSSLQADVIVPDCPTCWLDAPEQPDEPDEPEAPTDGTDPEVPDDAEPGLVLDAAQIAPSRLLAGGEATVTLRLRGPAPEGGATIAISVSDPAAITAPAEFVIAGGESEGSFAITANEVAQTTPVTLSFTLDGRVINRDLTVAVEGVEIERFTLLPQQVLGGLVVQATLRLVEDAGENGAVIELSSSTASVVPPATVTVPAGSRSVRFDIQTFEVSSDVMATLTASSGVSQRSAQLVVKSEVFGDVNNDGVVDGIDLAALLLALGTSDPDADLNNDGVVDLDDLTALVDLLESIGGTGQQPGADRPVIARWVPVPITDCDDGDLDASRSADLYLGYRDLPDIIGVTSAPGTGLRTDGGGVFYQHPLGDDGPPNAAAAEFLPCLQYDSYITIGEARPFITPSFGGPPLAWGDALVGEWLPSPGVSITSVRDAALFGDDRDYVRIARVTLPAGSPFVGGTLDLVGVRGTSTFDDTVTVHHCSSCWGQFDLTGDGIVSDADVEVMIGLLGQPHPSADLDGDGLVDLDDIRLLIAAIGS